MQNDCRIIRQEPDALTDSLTRSVIGAAIEVHRNLGPGFLESFYERAFSIELKRRGIPFKNQVCFPVLYKGIKIGENRLDLVIGELIIVELKSVEALVPVYTAQIISYLRATKYKLGLLINFNVTILKYGIRRIICSD